MRFFRVPYGGTDYDLDNTQINNSHYSLVKTPVGFPMNPAKWSIKVSDSKQHSLNVATATWYNFGSKQISIPSGIWNLSFYAYVAYMNTSLLSRLAVTLSTSNSSETDQELTSIEYSGQVGAVAQVGVDVNRSKMVELTSKTTYYFLVCSSKQGIVRLNYATLNLQPNFVILAVCAYL